MRRKQVDHSASPSRSPRPPYVPVNLDEAGSTRRGGFSALTLLHIGFTAFVTVVALYQWMRILQLETEFAVEESSLRGNVYMHKDETLSPMNVGDVRLERKNKEIELLKAELKKLEKVKKLQVKAEKLVEETERKFHAREEPLVRKVIRMENSLRKLARTLAEAKFGQPPYHALITVKFPTSMGEPFVEQFKVELAPMDLVPYAVYTWLSQVEAGLWDGCAFVRNAPHVLQATTRNMEHVSQQRRFAKAKKEIDESLAFQDYSKKFPHEKYTLGFAGRPGGPDFYVSTQDNTYNHGPGGQQSYALKEEADSCFGKVVSGFDVIGRMHRGKVQKDNYKSLVEPIGIEKIEIVDG